MIPDKVVMVQDVRKCYNCKIGATWNLEIANEFEKLCDNGKVKYEYAIVEKRGLTKVLAFPTVFKIEWIRIVVSIIHDGTFWLKTRIVKFNKKIVNRVTCFQTIDQPKTLRSDMREAINKIGAKWNDRGMTIDNIKDPLLNFVVRVISHKFITQWSNPFDSRDDCLYVIIVNIH